MSEVEITKKPSPRLIKILLLGLVLSFIVNMVMFVMVLGSLQQIYRHICQVTDKCEKSEIFINPQDAATTKTIEKAHSSFSDKKIIQPPQVSKTK